MARAAQMRRLCGLLLLAPGICTHCSLLLLPQTPPRRDHVFLNKGVGATSSGIFAACIKQMVPAVSGRAGASRQWAGRRGQAVGGQARAGSGRAGTSAMQAM